MFDINFYDYGATYVRIPNESIKLDIDLELLFYILDEDTLVVYFKDFDLSVSCYFKSDFWDYINTSDPSTYSLELFEKIMLYVCVAGNNNTNRSTINFNEYSEDIVWVCRYLPEIRETLLQALDFISNYEDRKKYGLFNIDFSPGYIIANRPQINQNISFEYLSWLITYKYILKVNYGKNIFLTSGWLCYDDAYLDSWDNITDDLFNHGNFWIKVTRGLDEQEVLFNSKCKNLVELEIEVLKAKNFVESIQLDSN